MQGLPNRSLTFNLLRKYCLHYLVVIEYHSLKRTMLEDCKNYDVKFIISRF